MTVCKHNCFVQKGSNETAFNWVIFSILCMSFDSSHNTLLYCVLLSWNSCAIFLFKTFTTSVFTPRDPVFETIFAHVFFRRRKNMLISHNIFGLAYFPFFPMTRFLWFNTIIILQSESLWGAEALYKTFCHRSTNLITWNLTFLPREHKWTIIKTSKPNLHIKL